MVSCDILKIESFFKMTLFADSHPNCTFKNMTFSLSNYIRLS